MSMGKESLEDWHRARRRLSFALVLGLFTFVLLRHAWICDDAFITFRTVRNLLAGLGPVWQPDERVQAYTHPLWMLLLAGWTPILHNIYLAAMVLSLALSIAALTVFLLGLRQGTAQALLGGVILISCKAFLEYSTSGLENPLAHLLYIVFLVLFLRCWDDSREGPTHAPRRLFILSMSAALLVCTRHDLALMVAPPLGYALWQARRVRRLWLAVLLGTLPFLGWELFSIVYYGFPFPNSAYAKLGAGISQSEALVQGLSYFVSQAQIDPLTLLVLAGSLVAVALVRGPPLIALAAGLFAYLLYFVKIGGDFMAGRFLSVPLLCSAAILSTALSRVTWRDRGWLWVAAPVFLLLGLVVTPRPTLTSDGDYSTKGPIYDKRGVADERAFYYPGTGLLRSGNQDMVGVPYFVAIGLHLPIGVASVQPAVGEVGFFAQPGVIIIDEVGLADPLLARLPKRPGPWRIGHLFREIPAGYAATREQGRNLIVDPKIAEFYRHLDSLIRGPLWSWPRFLEIWHMNTRAGPRG